MSMVDRIALSPLNQNVHSRLGAKPLVRKSFRPLSLPDAKPDNILESKPSKTAKDDVDVYVSRMKFKLKLALYKLNHNRIKASLKVNNYKIYNCEYLIKSPSSSSTKLLTGKSLSTLTPNKITKKPHTSLYKKSFQNSININLTEKTQSSSSSLNSVVNKRSNSSLKLFTVKKNTSTPLHEFHIPLTLNDSKLALASTSNSLIASKSVLSRYTTNLSESSNVPPSLPSINKILKTPLKLTGSSCSDDVDQTIDDHSFDDGKKQSVNSSPLKHFATPNSFSVAKSLLQLGSGIYN